MKTAKEKSRVKSRIVVTSVEVEGDSGTIAAAMEEIAKLLAPLRITVGVQEEPAKADGEAP